MSAKEKKENLRAVDFLYLATALTVIFVGVAIVLSVMNHRQIVEDGFNPRALNADFGLYSHPDHLEMDWSQGPGGGAAWNKNFPYRAVFFGAEKQGSSYNSVCFVLYSKQKSTNYLSFSYLPSRGTYGYIRATAIGNATNTYGINGDWVVMSRHWDGVSSSEVNLYTYNFGQHTRPGTYYFEFDFQYVHEGNASPSGINSVSGVHYDYLYYCTRHPDGPSGSGKDQSSSGGGSGGGSSGGSSSGGGSSGGSSSGGGSSGGSSGGGDSSSGGSSGGGSGGDSSSDDWPYEDDEPSGGETLGEGGSHGWTEDGSEKGDTWTLPSFSEDDGVEGEAEGHRELKPGTDEWGPSELEPGSGDWGLQDWFPNDDQWGLIDFGQHLK